MSTEKLSPIPKSRSLKKKLGTSTPTKKVESKVAVLVRVRPYISREDASKDSPFVLHDNQVEYTDPNRLSSGAFQFGKQKVYLIFTFLDYVFQPMHSTKYIYDTVLSNLIQSACEGYNGKSLKFVEFYHFNSYNFCVWSNCIWKNLYNDGN